MSIEAGSRPASAEEPPQEGDLLREGRGRRGSRAHEARRPADRPAERVRVVRADPERRVRTLKRLRLQRRVLELPELAREGHARLGPEGPHEPQPLVEARHPARRGDAEGRVDLRVPAEADPDVEAAARELIQGGEALREMHRGSGAASAGRPSRAGSGSVTAAAHARSSTGSRLGSAPSTCSTTQALSKPRASARSRKRRIRGRSMPPVVQPEEYPPPLARVTSHATSRGSSSVEPAAHRCPPRRASGELERQRGVDVRHVAGRRPPEVLVGGRRAGTATTSISSNSSGCGAVTRRTLPGEEEVPARAREAREHEIAAQRPRSASPS